MTGLTDTRAGEDDVAMTGLTYTRAGDDDILVLQVQQLTHIPATTHMISQKYNTATF